MSRLAFIACWIALTFSLLSCSRSQVSAVAESSAKPASPGGAAATPARRAHKALSTAPFGGDRWGFVQASSADGGLVVLRRFEGATRPSFGQHGEPDQKSDLALFDRFEDTEVALEEIIDIDASRRYLLLLYRGGLSLADSQTGTLESLAGASMDADKNACLPPRQGSFSPEGKRVGWVTAGGFRVRDLASRDEWTVKPEGRLWRGWPEDTGRSALLAESPAGSSDWPEQHTTCACRWCRRFAASMSSGGWGGPGFQVFRVGEDGSREKGKPSDGRGDWHGKTTSGCSLEAASTDKKLDHGPWRWACGAAP